jgi:hypothetical protein
MVTTTELILVVVVLALLLGAYRIIRAVKPLIVNAVIGLIVLFVASFLGLGVEITPIAVLICALGGVPGAILVVILASLDVAFVATLSPLLTVFA